MQERETRGLPHRSCNDSCKSNEGEQTGPSLVANEAVGWDERRGWREGTQ